MGNVLLDELRKDPVEVYERWVEENPELVGKEVLLDNKLFRTTSFRYHERQVIVKVFFRRDQTPVEDSVRSLQMISTLSDSLRCANILPMRVVEMRDYKDKELQKLEDNFVMATRQVVKETLEERLSRRPHCHEQEKHWLIFQMMLAVHTVHTKMELYHGNLRTSNFLLTGYQMLMLTDFALYKPNYILQDTEQGLAEFRLFYSSSLDRCNLAPEKITDRTAMASQLNLTSCRQFVEDSKRSESSPSEPDSNPSTASSVEPASKQELQRQVRALQKMDVFSLGLSILEVLNDGKPALTYQELLKMGKESTNLQTEVGEACSRLQEGQSLEQLLVKMLAWQPDDRPGVEQLLKEYMQAIDQDVYLLLWCVLSAFGKTSFANADLRLCLLQAVLAFVEEEIKHSSVKLVMSRPKCLESFKPLKILAELVNKKLMYSLPMEPQSMLARLLKHVEAQELGEAAVEVEEELIADDKDERQMFFIHPLKHKQIAKRQSFVAESASRRDKLLCPPRYTQQLSALLDGHQREARLSSQQQSNRLQTLLAEYRKNQSQREERIAEKRPFYGNSQLLVKVIWSCFRSAKYVASKLAALEMIALVAGESPDDSLLKFVLPCLLTAVQDSELPVAKYALNGVLDLFYLFVDPFHNEDDCHYFEIILELFLTHIRVGKLRLALFGRLREVYLICEWLEVHCRLVGKQDKKQSLGRIVETLRTFYGSYSREEVRCLMENMPEPLLPLMFEFFISYINTEKVEGLKCSTAIARHISADTHKNILDAFDSCVETGLDEQGIGLFHAIRYFAIRKCTSQGVQRKIACHVLHPSKWIRDEATDYIRMCLGSFPPTKNFFFFREIFPPPFPLRPDDLLDELLLPLPLHDSDVDFKAKAFTETCNRKVGLTEKLFLEYLKNSRSKPNNSRERTAESEQWSKTTKCYREQSKDLLQFKSHVRKQIETLYECNLFYYFWNMKARATALERDKGYPELAEAFRKSSRFSLDTTAINYQKKELFDWLLSIVNSNCEKLLTRFPSENPCDRLRLAEAITVIGEVLYKFEQFKIKPIARLGEHVRKPTEFDKLPRPKGILVSEIFEHRDTISALERVGEYFFLSGSHDGQVKVFNARKIELNVTASSEASLEIHTGEGKTRISSICAFERTFTAAVATSKGQIKLYQLERLPARQRDHSGKQKGDSLEVQRYSVAGEIEKVVTMANELQNECFGYVTAEGVLGVQDIRFKSKALTCLLGKERGLPRCLTPTQNHCLLVGTIDGYLLNYDLRCNIVSHVLQLHSEERPIPITSITACPLSNDDREQLYAVTYPSRHYEISCFSVYEQRESSGPGRLFTSGGDDIVSTVWLDNRTSEEQFKLCNNSLIERRHYSQLADFNKNFNIFDYLTDPLTRKEQKVKEVWIDRCKNRYTQLSSIYAKKSLPFLEYLPNGILTCFNPSPNTPADRRSHHALSLLVEVRPNKDYTPIESVLTARSNTFKTHSFAAEESPEYLTLCRVLPNMVVVATRSNVLKVYK